MTCEKNNLSHIQQLKKNARKYIRLKRENLTTTQINQYNAIFLEKFIIYFNELNLHKTSLIIGGYMPINNELDILPLLDYCKNAGILTALPYSHNIDKKLTYHVYDHLSLVPDECNIMAPNPLSDIVVPDLIIAPALGVCLETKKRLGYGGGFFDRYAEQYPHIKFISAFMPFQCFKNPLLFQKHDLVFQDIFLI